MGRPKRPVETLKKHLTKEEIEERKVQEELARPNIDNIKCPSWLKDKAARKEYKKIALELQELGLLTNLDVNALASYCNAFSAYINTVAELEGQPLVVEQTNKAGFTNLVENPLIKIQMKYSDEMKKLAAVLGLTIDSRLKLIVPKAEKKKDEIKKEFGDI